MYIGRNRRGRIVAEDELIEDEVVDTDDMGDAEVSVAPEASDLLFEAEDVAELVAEVTGEVVEVSADDDAVVFTVGDNDFTVEPDGSEEIVESSVRLARKRRVQASKRPVPARRGAARKPVSASKKVGASKRVIRKVPSSRR